MQNPLTVLVAILSHPVVAVAALTGALVAKLIIACFLCWYLVTREKDRLPLLLLLIFVVTAACNDLEYLIAGLLRGCLKLKGELFIHTFAARINWIVYLPRIQSLALFFYYLLYRRLKFSWFWLLNGAAGVISIGSFLYLIIGYYGIPSDSSQTLGFEWKIVTFIYSYAACMCIWILWHIINALRSQRLPRILYRQISMLAKFIIPFQVLSLGMRICIEYHLSFPFIPFTKPSLEVIIGIFTTISLYFLSTKIMQLRFLNIRKDITSSEQFNFLRKFKDILEQLSYTTGLNELTHITQTFFSTAFNITRGKTHLMLRTKQDTSGMFSFKQNGKADLIEKFIEKESVLTNELYQAKILIRDDYHFTSFYEENSNAHEIVAFLDSIHADIFLPIYERSSIIAYCIVEQDARPRSLYTSKERDEMIVFTTYLSNIISLVKQSSFAALQLEKKELTEELYHKHQEINQYKEVLRSYMRSSESRRIGIVYYKNRKFTYANEAAHDFIPHDMNTHVGHPLSKACTSVAKRVQEFRTAQTTSIELQGKKLVVSGLPNMDGSSSIILLYYPELSDMVKNHIEHLPDPSTWDYALYLETTTSGRLISSLIPGTTEQLMRLKISLLSAALSKKTLLLTLPPDDLQATVDVLHAISLRTTLHRIELTGKEQSDEVARSLFGINKLIDQSEGLLEQLDEHGTLFIENIEYLSAETQSALAHYLTFGYFKPLKSDKNISSRARIICSTTKQLAALVEEGSFCKELYQQLESTCISMPTLQEEDITCLAQGFADQLIQNDTFKHLLSLSERDTLQLIQDTPLSIHELKTRVEQLVKEKTYKHQISKHTTFDPAYLISDPDIAQAVRLGRKALRDPHLMALLWHRFKNQNKIAQLLGVNRSSVNRRCQEYKLT